MGRIARRTGLVLGAVLAAVILTAAALYAFVQTQGGRDWLAGRLEAALSEPGGIEVRLSGLTGQVPQSLRLARLELRDGAGTWLSAKDLALDWRPLALASGWLEVDLLAARTVSLTRLPEPGAGADDGGGAPAVPRLPLDLRVGRITIDEADLGEAVLGAPARVAVEAAFGSRDGTRLQSSVKVERRDGMAGEIRGEGRYDLADQTLTLDLTVSEPAGGLTARLLDLPGLPAVSATLAGDGPLDAWAGRLDLALEGLAAASAELTLTGRAPLTLRLDGRAETEPEPGDPLWDLIAGESRFAATGAWDGRGLRLQDARLELPAADLALSGSFDSQQSTVEAQVRLHLKDPDALKPWIDDLSINGLEAALQAKGPLHRPVVTLDAKAARLTGPGLAASDADLALAFQPSRDLTAGPPAGALQASGRFAELRLDDLRELEALIGTDPAWSVTGNVDLEAGEATWSALSIETGRARLAGPGRISIDAGDGEADVTLALSDLAGLSVLTGLGIQGRAEVAAPLSFANFGETLEARLTATLAELAIEDPLLQTLVGADPSLSARLALDAARRLRLTEIEVEGARARIDGDLALDSNFSKIASAYRLDVPDTAVLSKPLGVALAGAALAEGRIDGPVDDPVLTGRLTWDSLAVEGTSLGPVEADYRIAGLATQPQGKLAAKARPEIGPVEGETEFALVEEALELSGLRLTAQALRVEGRATAPLDGTPLTAALSGESGDLGPWAAHAGLAARGAGRMTLRLIPDKARQRAMVEARLTGLTLLPGRDDELRAERADLRFQIEDLFGTPSGTATLDAAGLVLAEGRLDRLSVTAKGDAGRADWTLDTEGLWRKPLALRGAGRIEVGDETLSLRLADLDGQFLGAPLSLQAPTVLSRTGERLRLAPTRLGVAGGTLAGELELSAARLRLGLDAADLDLAALSPFWPGSGLAGSLRGKVQAEGTPARPTGSLALEVAGLRLSDLKEAPPVDLSVDGDWRAGRLALDGRMAGFANRAATFEANLPLRLDPASLAPDVPLDQPATAAFAWVGPLAEIWPLVPITGHRLEGQGEIRLAMSGTLSEPRSEGRLSITDGEYEHFSAGTLLRGLEARVELSGRRAILSRLEANDGGQGRLTGRGVVDLDPARDFPLDLEAKLENFTVLRRDEATASTDGELALKGSLAGARLAGQLRTREVEIRVIDRLPPEVVDLGVIEVNSRGDKILTAAPETANGFDLALDLAVAIPRRAFLRGRGLDSEWAGRFDVAGTADAPEIAGELTLVRGQLSFLGKDFKLERGSVAFEDPKTLDPRLDVSAVNRGGDLTVTAQVSGPATNPELSLSSNPPLPEDEIVSRLLFGKSSTKLGKLEAVQLGAAVAELSGGGGGPGLFDLARDTLGMDVLRIESTGNGETESPALSAGKYVTDEIFVGVKQGADPSSTEVGVEVEVTPNIFLESGVGQTGESNVGVKFKWDY